MNSEKLRIEIIAATRGNKEHFLTQSALGLSLRRTAWDRRIRNVIELENTKPLPIVYNRAIDAKTDDAILVFMHDDVWLDDFQLSARLVEALDHFDVVGVAGNRRTLAKHVGWAFADDTLAWDRAENLCGAISHGSQPFGEVSVFGDAPSRCELLDGVFLAARRRTLQAANVRFDPQFDFHFYDLDFCRSAGAASLTLGVWPISITHQSAGKFGSDDWLNRLALYRQKWNI